MNTRYHHCPQLKIYDKIGFKWLPHLMFMNYPNFRSEECNTDSYGFRFNSKKLADDNKSIFDIKINKKTSIMVGSSTTFGVGATKDERTIPGNLTNVSDNFFYNFGGRAFNGFQEIILTELMINQIADIKKILLYSGINDIYMSYNESFISSFPGPFYYNSKFLNSMENSSLNLKKKLLNFFIPSKKIEKSYYPKIKLEEIVSRNIKMWKIFSKSTNSELSFFLPPFLPWCKHENNYTKEEREIDDYIKSQNEVKYTAYYEAIKKDYNKVVKLFEDHCNRNEIKFYDCNTLFHSSENNNKWLFVDKVHLTDYGNELIADFISKKI